MEAAAEAETEATRGFFVERDVRDETDAARDDENVIEDDEDDDDAEAHEDYSCKTPFERLARDVEAQLRRWMDGAATSTSARTSEFANHGLHWRKEAYGCELFVDETWCDVGADGAVMEAEAEAGGAVVNATLGEYLSAAKTRRAATVEFTPKKRYIDAWDPSTFFDVPCVVLVRPLSASGQFIDVDEALTVRSAFVLAASALGVGGTMAIVSPRGYYERDFTGDVCDKVGGDAVLETDVTRLTRMNAIDEAASRTFVGFVNRFLKLVRSERLDSSTTAIEAEAREMDESIVSARITHELTNARARDSTPRAEADDASDDDIEDMRAPLVGVRRPNVHEDLENADFGLHIEEWDDHCPWARWVSVEDPWRSLEVDALWLDERLGSLYTYSELDITQAPHFILRGELTQAARDRGEDDDELISSGTSSISEMIYYLVQHAEVLTVGDGSLVPADTAALASANFWISRGLAVPQIPNDSMVRGVLLDIFVAMSSNDGDASDAFSPPYKTAPPNTLLTRFALHACLFGNVRALAHVWNAFVRDLRHKYWERGRVIPGVASDSDVPIDLGTCLLNQKLQLLNQCILRRNRKSDADQRECDVGDVERLGRAEKTKKNAGRRGAAATAACASDGLDALLRSSRAEQRMNNPDDDLDLNALLNDDDAPIRALARVTSASSAASSKTDDDAYVSADEGASDTSVDDDDTGAIAPEGIAETLTIRLVRPPHALMNVPLTQETPLMTEDMSAEREARLRAFGDDERGRADRQRAQSDSLVSDMSAFKAANPSAAFEDFVRWHSPKDWIDGDDVPTRAGGGGRPTDESAPRGPPRGALSERMRRDGNAWKTLWESSPRVSARAQKTALFDPIVEGEKALHHLETTAAAALVDVVARCAVTSDLALLAASRAVRSHPDDTKDAIHRASTAISSVFAVAENRALSLDEFDAVVGELQLAELAVFRAESLLARLPSDLPPSIIHDLLHRAHKWESARQRDIHRASSRAVVFARVADASSRAALLARVARPRAPSSIEYAVRASPTARTIADHRARACVTDGHVRASIRISAPRAVFDRLGANSRCSPLTASPT